MNLTNKQTSSLELNILNRLSEIKTIDQYTLRQIFIELMKVCFNNPNNFIVSMGNFPSTMLNYTYTDGLIAPTDVNKNKSVVTINGDFSYGDNAAQMEYLRDNFKPAVFVGLTDVTMEGYGVQNDVMEYLPDRSGEVLTIKCNTKVVMSCYGMQYAEALVMGQVVTAFLYGVRKFFKNIFKQQPYRIPVVTSPKVIDISNINKMYKTDVMLDVSYNTNWVTKVESVLLKTIEFNFSHS